MVGFPSSVDEASNAVRSTIREYNDTPSFAEPVEVLHLMARRWLDAFTGEPRADDGSAKVTETVRIRTQFSAGSEHVLLCQAPVPLQSAAILGSG